MAVVLKTTERVTVPGVRIPLPPPDTLQQMITDVRSQPRPAAEWQPFPDLEPFLQECDPVARKLAAARRSVTRIVLVDRGDRT